MRYVAFFLFTALLASSCSTTSRTSTAKRMDIYGSGVIQYPVIAELDVGHYKVVGSAQTRSGQTTTSLRNKAIADALKESNADVLVEPVFETETLQGVTRVTVTGFPGTYIGFRSATLDDLPFFEAGILQKASVFETVETEKKSNKAAAFLGSIAGMALLVLLLQAGGI